MDKILEVFKRDRLLSKKEVLVSLKNYIGHIKYDSAFVDTEESKKIKIALFHRFKSSIENTDIPTLTDPWWYYTYLFTGTGISLLMCKDKDVTLDKTGDYICCSTEDVSFSLISIESNYVSVEAFAKIKGVKDVTVRQWIRRGKLRYAKKMGSRWMIPEITNNPAKGYLGVTYIFNENDPIILDQFPQLKDCESMNIYQDYYDKSQFHCIYYNKSAGLDKDIPVNKQMVEILESNIIASGKAKVIEDTIEYVPSKEEI